MKARARVERSLLKPAFLACLLVFAAASAVCAITYVFSGDAANRHPQIVIETQADKHLAGTIYRTPDRYTAFKRALADISERRGISIYVAFMGKLAPGSLVSRSVDEGVTRATAHLSSLDAGFERDNALVIVLVDEPRTFEFVGLGSVRDRFAIRSVSAQHGLRHLQLVYVASDSGLPLTEAVTRIDAALEPLNFYIRHAPVPPGFVESALQTFGGFGLDLSQKQAIALSVDGLKRIASFADSERGGLTLLALLLLIVIVTVVAEAASKVFRAGALKLLRLPAPTASGEDGSLSNKMAWTLDTALGVLVKTLVFAPIVGCVVVLVYGDLKEVISLSQIANEDVATLVRLTRSLNQYNLSLPFPLVVLLAFGVVFSIALTLGELLVVWRVPSAISRSVQSAGDVLVKPLALVALGMAGAALVFAMLAFPVLFSLEGSVGTVLITVSALEAIGPIWAAARAG